MAFGRQTLSLAELETTEAFVALTDQQKTFVRAWVESGGDQVFAFNQSYSAPDGETARKGSYSVMQRTSIKRTLDAFLQKSPKELFLEEVTRVSKNPRTRPSQIRALELRAALEFGVDLKTLKKEVKESIRTATAPKAEPAVTQPLKEFNRDARYELGAVVLFRGAAVRITKISAEGRAQSYEPVDKVVQS